MQKKKPEELNLIDNYLINAMASDQEVGEKSMRCLLPMSIPTTKVFSVMATIFAFCVLQFISDTSVF